jgi:hypothetical protein
LSPLPTEKKTWTLATMELVFEPPDLLVVRSRPRQASPDEQVEDIKRHGEIVAELAKEAPVAMLIAHNGQQMSAEARKVAAKTFDPKWFRQVAMVGASITTKLAVKGITLAYAVAGKPSTPMEFFDTEADAQAFLVSSRTKKT